MQIGVRVRKDVFLKELKKKFQILWPLVALLIIGVVLYCERQGIVSRGASAKKQDTASISTERTPAVSAKVDTAVIVNSGDETSDMLYGEMSLILDGMKVAYDTVEVSGAAEMDLTKYNKMVLCITDLDLFGDTIQDIIAWVKSGGALMNMVTYDISSSFRVMRSRLGIIEGGEGYAPVSGFTVEEGFMVAGDKHEYKYDEEYWFSLSVLLDEHAKVYVRETESGLPLMWEYGYGYGIGKFVVINQALTSKAGRGFWAAAFTLLDRVSVYPVINASAFYLDDFPAPVPGGNGEYIKKEYGMDISNFYANVWWKDMLDWEKEYGIIHTGLIIEDYSDIVEAPFPRTESVERFRFFGNMLLNNGGELGFHGYNHMPLCLENFDYKGLYDSYKLWKSEDEMRTALDELESFSSELFEGCEFRVYVPPSNILSQEGRRLLASQLSELRAIASTYLPGDCVYEQEFGIAEDGIIETPRITSGAIMDEYTYLIAFSELNFHYVQSHFIHPDDALDEDRGAALGWHVMSQNLEDYLSYIYESAPNIEDVTGSGMADAVENYSLITLDRQKRRSGLAFDIGGFNGKASFMLRVNNGEITAIEGADYENITGDLYVLTAYDSHVEISVR